MSVVLAFLLLFTTQGVKLEKVYHNLTAPTDIRIIIRIEPHPDNRQLTLILDGPFSTASTITLYDERIIERWIKDVRAEGCYELKAIVTGPNRRRAQDRYEFCLQ